VHRPSSGINRLLDSPAVLILNVRVPGELPRRVVLDRPVLTFGRSSTNDVPLADRTLSRVHARIEARNGTATLVDLGSRNGTSLNGSRISESIPLAMGDRISLGETTIDVFEESTTRVVVADRETPAEVTLFRSASDLVKPHLRGWDPRQEAGADELARLNAQLRILNEVSVEFLSDMPLNRLLSLVVEKVFAYLAPDRGLLMLADETGELRPEVVRYAPGVDPTDIRLSKTLIRSVVEGKNGVLLIDSVTDLKLAAAESLRLTGVTSCLAAPLLADDRVIGLIYLEVRLGRKSFTEEDLRLLSSLANTAAIKIQNLRLQVESIAKQRIEREMALAWDIQRRLLPEKEPVLSHTELLGRAIPSRTVSGDYYDFFVRADGTTDIVVADVCGKGMGASILAASVQAAFQVWAGENSPPDRLCAGLNDLVYRRTSPEKFVTFFHVLYDPESGSLIYTNAGHNPGILIRKATGEHELLHAHGMPLGLFPGRSYSSCSLTLGPGDLLVLYTDGVTEASNAADDEFGIERLIQVAKDCREKPLLDVEAAIDMALADFVAGTPYADDRTLVLLRRT
jgi:phosphoserine phosphatase RsbU/P